jgi:hypothetical protein
MGQLHSSIPIEVIDEITFEEEIVEQEFQKNKINYHLSDHDIINDKEIKNCEIKSEKSSIYNIMQNDYN